MMHMNRLISSLPHKFMLPFYYNMNDQLERIEWNKYVPYKFIADSLVVTRDILLHNDNTERSEYYNAILALFSNTRLVNWVADTLRVLKEISTVKDLRVIEDYASTKTAFDLQEVNASFNYVFDFASVDKNIKILLGITEAQELELEELDADLVEILTIASSYGSMIKTSKSLQTTTKQMTSYSDVNRITKANLASPLFMYKFSLKLYNINQETPITIDGDHIILGYFLSNRVENKSMQTILKLLGTLLLTHDKPKITIYSFYGGSYNKDDLYTKEEIISYFSAPKQLMLYPIDNSVALQTLIIENKGKELIFLPNVKADCVLLPVHTGLCKINILSYNSSKYNLKYSTICKRTNGIFLTI